jgi:hypothetical protein
MIAIGIALGRGGSAAGTITCFPCEISFTEHTFSMFSRGCAVSVLTQRTVDRVVLLAGGKDIPCFTLEIQEPVC